MGRRGVLVAVLVIVVAAVAVLLSRERTKGGDDPLPDAPVPRGPWTLVVDVRDPAGTPVAADVWVTNEQDDLLEMVEAEAGAAIAFDVAGKVAVRVVAADLAPRFLEGLIAPPGTEKRVVVELDRGLSISGEILEPDDARLRGGRLEIEGVPLDPPWSAVRGGGWDVDPYGGEPWVRSDFHIGSDWSFELPNLAPGRYRLHVKWSGSWEEYRSSEDPIVLAGSAGKRIQLVRPPESAWVTVRFIDATTGEPPSTVGWHLTRDGDTEPWQSSWGRSDIEEIRFLPGQGGTMTIEADGYVPHEPIRITAGGAGENTEVVCELVPDPGAWADLDLLLRDEDGVPVTDAAVWSGWSKALGDEEGRYKLRVSAGLRRIQVDPDWEKLSRLLTFELPHEEEIRFGRGEQVRREWTMKRGGFVLVRGEVQRVAWIIARGKRTALTERWLTTVDKRPQEWLELVPPGRYRVEARCGGRLRGIDIEVRAGEVTTVTFPLER